MLSSLIIPDKVLGEILGSEIVELLWHKLHKLSRITLALQNLFRVISETVKSVKDLVSTTSNFIDWSLKIEGFYHFTGLGVERVPGRVFWNILSLSKFNMIQF